MRKVSLCRVMLCLMAVQLPGAVVFAGGFDWGDGCSSGSGQFTQYIGFYADIEVGRIPEDKADVRIFLRSESDVDVRLVDEATGYQIVAWPYGDVSGPTEACTAYEGVEYCYSGYNGTNGELGDEWIRINGVTNRPVTMSAFGYRDGEAVVSYEYGAPPNCVDSGEGEFAQWVSHSNVLAVGQIPAGKWNVDVQLEARGGRDIDIQLFDGDYAIVKWDANESNVGALSGPTQGTTDYEGMKITYSGYNGRDQNWGKEDIRVSGKLTRTLTIKVFGYAEGYADVTYSWGHGAEGDSCGGRTAVPPHPCQENLVCKGSGLATDQTGVCRPLNWCDSRSTAAMDCRGLVHPAFPGAWTCIGHECTWTDSGNGPLTISAATLAANPGAYDGKTVTITDSIVEGLAACTKMLCSPWNPCCNTCNGTQAFKVGGQQIQLKGLTCIGNECNWEQNCSFDSGALVQVTGVVEVQTFGANVIISINVSDSQEL